MAETVTLAAEDVLLDQLLAQLANEPLARRLLFGAAVYRQPVDVLGLIWTVGEPVAHAPDPVRAARLQAMEERLIEAWKENPAANWGDLFTVSELEQYQRDFAEENRPPVAAPAGFAAAQQQLLELSLLAPVHFADDEDERFLVHRWTADALAKRASADEWATAHRAAAAYWRWRVDTRPQSRAQDIADLLEARYHLQVLVLGDLAAVHTVSGAVILQLHTWGAWEWEERLLRETLAWMPDGSREAAAPLHQLGIVAQHRGDYDAALDWYRQALAIDEQLGNRAGMASSYHKLGMVAQHRGEYDAALDWYRQALAIDEQLGDRAGMASSYHQLGIVAQERGKYDAALDWYRQSLVIFEQLGDRAGMARSLSQIGIFYTETAHAAAAVPLTLQSLALCLEIQSPQVGANLYWLSRQRQILGGDPFRAIVAEHWDAETAAHLCDRLDAFDRAQRPVAETEASSPAVQASEPPLTSWLMAQPPAPPLWLVTAGPP